MNNLTFERTKEQVEGLRPLPFVHPYTFLDKVGFVLRILFDLRLNAIFRSARSLFLSFSGQVLDVGCGGQPWGGMLAHCRYVGLEMASIHEKFGYARRKNIVYYNGMDFPFSDNAFNHIVCTEVIEHVADPKKFLLECVRCLKSGGSLYLTVPFSARYHYIPYDYWRFTPAGLNIIFQQAGLANFTIKPLGTDVCSIINKINLLILKLLLSPYSGRTWLKSALQKILGIVCLPLFFFFTFLGLFLIQFQVGCQDDPLGYEVLATK